MPILREPGSCPTCGGPSTVVVYVNSDGAEARSPEDCVTCARLWWQRTDEVRDAIARHCPGLSVRTANCLKRSDRELWHAGGILAASDDALLGLRNFGKAALAEVRSFVPQPSPRSPSPEIPASFWGERPDVFSLVGG